MAIFVWVGSSVGGWAVGLTWARLAVDLRMRWQAESAELQWRSAFWPSGVTPLAFTAGARNRCSVQS